MLHIFDTKKDDNTVYVRLEDAKKAHPDVDFDSLKTYSVGDLNGLIKESDYNNNLLLYNKDNTELSITKVQSLETEIHVMRSIRPLKTMFLSGLGMSPEHINLRIQKEEEEEVEKIIRKLSAAENHNDYDKKVAYFKNNEEKIKEHLLPLGLELQFVTEIKDAHAGIIVFLAGKDVFYELYAAKEIEWESFEKTDDGFTFFNPASEGEETVHIRSFGYEFREHTPLENIQWVLCNMPIKNDFTDEVNCDEGGIYLTANIPLIMKYFNSVAFPENIFIDGLVEEKLFCSSSEH